MVELEDTEAGIAGKQRVVGFDLGCGAAQAFFGQLGNGARFVNLVAEFCSSLLIFVCRIKRLR